MNDATREHVRKLVEFAPRLPEEKRARLTALLSLDKITKVKR